MARNLPSQVRKVLSSASAGRVWFVVRLLFVGFAAWLILRSIDLKTFTAHLAGVNLPLLMLSLVVAFGASTAVALRWKVLTNLIVPDVSLKSLIAFNLIGAFYSQFLPGNIGGDVMKGYYLSRGRANKVTVGATAIVERLIGMLTNGLVGALALLSAPRRYRRWIYRRRC